ncbi:hypothetical protein NFH98_20975 [Halomonas sp. H33-56]|uniref:hypothetical protein n=1 Tax=Halomonas sp. H33-56 TaxID=2950873 RepID=UPI0032DFAE7F
MVDSLSVAAMPCDGVPRSGTVGAMTMPDRSISASAATGRRPLDNREKRHTM